MLKGFAVLVLLSTMRVPVSAQVASAELSGTILDSSGAAIPGARITAKNAGTNIARENVADSTGNYLIPLLPPGEYLITVEASGFKKVIQTGFSLQINQQASLNFTLQLGQMSEEIQVTGQAAQLETESS